MTGPFRLLLALSIAPLVVAQSKYQTDLLAMNPFAYWPLNGNANDATGHSNNGLLPHGGTFSSSLTSPVESQSLALTGGAQVITVGGASSIFSLSALQAFTATAWIRTDCQGPTTMLIMGKADPVSITGWAMLVDNGNLGAPANGGRLAFALFASGTPLLLVESTNAVNDGRWRMVTATYDGSGSANGVRLYIDGNNAPTTTLANSVSGSILNSAPFTIGNTTDGADPFEGSISGAAVFGSALAPAQIVQLATDSLAARAVLGQFAFGKGWYSAVYFSNASLNQVSFTVNFIGDDGNPMVLPSITGSSKTITLAPGGTAVIEAPNTGDTLVQGYVSVALPVGVTGYGVFRQSVAGIADQEAVAPLTYPGVTNQTLVYDETSFITGVAIVNPSNVVTTVTVTVEDTNGNVIGTSSPALTLQPFTKIENALRSIPGLNSVVGNRGIVKFSVPSGNVLVLGLRFKGSAFTSIPAVGQRQLFDFPGEPLF